MALKINEEKTKVLICSMTKSVQHSIGQNLSVGQHNFEIVDEFKYLVVNMNNTNNIAAEINPSIIVANKCYFALSKHLKRRTLDSSVEISNYRTLIATVLTYASEAPGRYAKLKKTCQKTLNERFCVEFLVVFVMMAYGGSGYGGLAILFAPSKNILLKQILLDKCRNNKSRGRTKLR